LAPGRTEHDERYLRASAEFGPALERLAHGYEGDPEQRRDLKQEIHVALWRSLSSFDGRCSLRTWVYRVAHNVGASHVLKHRANGRMLVGLDELVNAPDDDNPEQTVSDRHAVDRLRRLIQTLNAADRQLVLLYLEGLDAATMAEVVGASPGAVSVKIHRIKAVLAERFHGGGRRVS
jgi:RNA polymerase sigma-70 factor (ECF subfamily)